MIDLNELRYFGQYEQLDVDELIAENSMFVAGNFTKVLETDEDEEVDMVEENGEERLVLCRIVICRENVLKCVACLTIFR